MKNETQFSILFPDIGRTEYKRLSETAFHDLGLDVLCKSISADPKEVRLISDVLANLTSDPGTAVYRQSIFKDILALPALRSRMTELFDKMEFIRTFGIMHKSLDKELGLWHLFHRMEELGDYIACVEAMQECLSDPNIKSEGLIRLREHIGELYNDSCFAEMKKDIAALKIKASDVQSITLGINVNERFEAVSMGLISVNSKPFKKSGIVSSFADALSSKDKLNPTAEWNGDMHYHQIDQRSGNALGIFEKAAGISAVMNTPFVDGRLRATVVSAAEGDGVSGSTFYLETVINKMLDSLVKRLRDTLTKYANIAVLNISQLIPEFVFYIRAAEYTERCRARGLSMCEPVLSEDEPAMDARGFYNMKLAETLEDVSSLVPNDLVFDREHTVYILTGANRGGKTTVTQAVGLLFVLAQAGMSVPAESFRFRPVDCIYTHFPADEDKTLDLGRLGEECVRFRDIYKECTRDSLLLMNETFSTTSFEEGFYIAKDAVRAVLKKQVRTIYNTHMHKLAAKAESFNGESSGAKAASLVVKAENGQRSFRIEAAPPEGMSYAEDIARKYGVTFDLLTGE